MDTLSEFLLDVAAKKAVAFKKDNMTLLTIDLQELLKLQSLKPTSPQLKQILANLHFGKHKTAQSKSSKAHGTSHELKSAILTTQQKQNVS